MTVSHFVMFKSLVMSLSKLWEMLKEREGWRTAVPRGQRESGTNEGQENNKFCADVQVPSTGCSEAQVYPALCSTWFSLKTRRGLPMTLSLAEAI